MPRCIRHRSALVPRRDARGSALARERVTGLVVAVLIASTVATLTGCGGNRSATPGAGGATPSTAPAPSQPAPPQPLPAEGPVVVTPPGAPGDDPATASIPPLASTAPSLQGGAPSAPLVPPGMLYVCTRGAGADARHTGIEYEPRVRDLCSRHPEMGVCQYEREACRRSGGRVFDSRGIEITKEIEAEYDRKVMRTRFRAG